MVEARRVGLTMACTRTGGNPHVFGYQYDHDYWLNHRKGPRMLALAIIVAVGGYLTIGFAYWAMRQAIPSAAKKTANLALQQLTVAGELVQATSRQVQAALAAEDPAVPMTHDAVIRAAEVHSQATKSLSEATGFLKELLAGLGGVFQALGALSPPVAALCVAVLMFLTAGGIEVADQLIS